jgi:dipeptidyl-peptidase 4
MKHRIFRRHSLLLLLAALLSQQPFAQQTQPSGQQVLTLDTMFSYAPQGYGGVRWLSDSSGYLRPEDGGLVRYDAETGARTIFVGKEKLTPPGSSAPLAIEDYALSADKQKLLVFTNTQRVWRTNSRGDYWVLELSSGKLAKLGGEAKPATLMFAKFSPDSSRVGYVSENNIYVENLSDRRVTQLTKDGTRYIINGTFDWVYEEELDLRDGWRWSPDGQRIAYWQLNSEGVREFQMINNTDELYPKIINFPYPKAGEQNSAGRIGIVGANAGATVWLDIPGDPRNHYLARMDWAGGNDEVVVQQLNRLQNTNLVMLGDIRTGKVRTVLTEKDEAWVDVLVTEDREFDVFWLDGGKRFFWISERDGWRHAYIVSRDGKEMKLITPGAYDVVKYAGIDEAGGWLYFIASPDNPTQRYLYRVPLNGNGKAERLTPTSQPGVSGYQISPRFNLAIQNYSSHKTPPQISLVRLPQHTNVRTLVDNKAFADRFSKLRPIQREFFRVDIGESVTLDGWMVKPPDFDPAKRYAVLFHVYGEPWGSTVKDAWGAFDNWHTMLAQQGYVVMSVDNRGTPAPRGRAWRKVIYKQLGVIASQDQANAVKAVIKKYSFVDPQRIGIWGWSGGGSMSLNAIFRYPDLYRMAMAVAPVPDLRYYDTIYQERYTGVPPGDLEVYRRNSPITFAHQLKGELLIVHGTGDDNVHYQGTEALINRLVAANKQFTLMSYPNRSHSIHEGEGTTRHLYGLLTRFLHEKLPVNSKTNE